VAVAYFPSEVFSWTLQSGGRRFYFAELMQWVSSSIIPFELIARPRCRQKLLVRLAHVASYVNVFVAVCASFPQTEFAVLGSDGGEDRHSVQRGGARRLLCGPILHARHAPSVPGSQDPSYGTQAEPS